MKKLLIVLLTFFASITVVNATSIDTIDMDIILDENGDATITETWTANATEGTEGWHPYYNVEDSEIKVISASIDGKEYTIEENWRENASMSEKAYKAGIYMPDSNEIDVVFGISNYGYHTYKVVYEITKFVKTVQDADIIYWQLFPYDFSAQPDNVNIKVSGPYEYPDDLDVWGYGKYGALCYVSNGAIYMTNDNVPISSNEYFVLLAKFPKNTFNTQSILDADFEYYHNLADQGATKYKEEKKSNKIWSIIAGIFYFLIFAIPILVGILLSKNSKYGYKDNKKIDKKDTPTFREIPCNKNIYYANALIKLNNFGYKEANILGAIILKWVRGDKIRFINEKKGLFNKDTSSIDMTKEVKFDNPTEEKLFDMMKEASGDGILESKELEKWCKKNYSEYLKLLEKIASNEIGRLKSEGHIYTRSSKEECKYRNVMDDTMYEDSKKLYGLKLFFDEFTSIDEKEVIEVKLWDEYLMFAYLFGVADKVAKQLKNLYPEQVKALEDQGLDLGTIMYINHLSTTSVHAASAARSAAQSYSSGGGGFSSGGGGGGSFGGGGGGGGFR